MNTKFRGTILPNPKFNAEKSAHKLQNALKGLGCDGRAIIDVMTGHSNNQRQEIKHKYKALYGAELTDVIKEELGGDFEEACLALLVPHAEYLIDCLHAAVNKRIDDNCICDIICTSQPWELRDIKTNYKQKYNTELEEDLLPKLNDGFGRLVKERLDLANEDVVPEDNQPADENEIQVAAQKLFDAGCGKMWGADEEAFLKIMCQKSSASIRVLAEAYLLIAGHELGIAVLSEFTGPLKKALFAIVQSAFSIPKYFAYQLNNAVRGLGTDDRSLIRVLVARSDFDLEDVKVEYAKLFKKELSEDVADDTSGDYRKLLLKIVQPKSTQTSR